MTTEATRAGDSTFCLEISVCPIASVIFSINFHVPSTGRDSTKNAEGGQIRRAIFGFGMGCIPSAFLSMRSMRSIGIFIDHIISIDGFPVVRIFFFSHDPVRDCVFSPERAVESKWIDR